MEQTVAIAGYRWQRHARFCVQGPSPLLSGATGFPLPKETGARAQRIRSFRGAAVNYMLKAKGSG